MAKRALLVGCNYPGTDAELKGCVNDVQRMKKSLTSRFGFDESDIVIMIDTDKKYPQPTGANIRNALSKIVENTSSGDYLFFHYSGHGTRVPPESGLPTDTGYDECIVPTDMNLLSDNDFREIVNKIPDGVSFTFVADSCHSGGLIEHEKEQIGNSTTAGGAISRGVKTRDFNFSAYKKNEYGEEGGRVESYGGGRNENEGERHGRRHEEEGERRGRRHEEEGEERREAYGRKQEQEEGGYGGHGRRHESEAYGGRQENVEVERYGGGQRRNEELGYGRRQEEEEGGYGRHGRRQESEAHGSRQEEGEVERYGGGQRRNEEPEEEQHFRRQQQGYSEGYGQQQRQSRFKGQIFEVPNHQEVRNKSISTDLLMGMFKSSFGAAGGSGIRSSLYSVFGKDSSPMVQTFIGLAISQAPTLLSFISKADTSGQYAPVLGIVSSLVGQGQQQESGGGFLGLFGGHKQQQEQADPTAGLGQALIGMIQGHVDNGGSELSSHDDLIQQATPIAQQVAASGDHKQGLAGWKPSKSESGYREDMGILISGCQSAETSADADPDGNPKNAYGALSNAIQQHLEESSGPVKTKDLVLAVRSKLSSTGFQQHPGLYCSDYNTEGFFICA